MNRPDRSPAPRARRRTRRRWPCAASLLGLLALASPGEASTLGPRHPAWSTPGVDPASLHRLLEEVDARARTAPALRTRANVAAAPSPARARRDAGTEPAPEGFGAWGGRMLVVPVLFADDGADPPVPLAELQRRVADVAAGGSLVAMFRDLSRGAFAPEAYVTPWVRLPQTRLYYSNVRDGVAVGNAGPRQLARHAACAAARLVDVSAFDDDGPDGVPGSGDDDGVIDLLLLLHPDVAFEVDPSPVGPRFLSHMDRAPHDDVAADCGVGADPYVLASARGPRGVWAHECMHLLGLEDLYDVSVNGTRQQQPSRGGLGIWSLMADGAWGGDGQAPSDLDAVSRDVLGWGTPHDASAGGAFNLAPAWGGDAPYLSLRPFGRWEQEFYLAEVRGPRAGRLLDSALPATGVLIYHVDDAVPLNCNSPTTCATRGEWVELLQADGRHDLEDRINNGDVGDPFTGAGGPDVLGANSVPSTQSHRPDATRVAPRIEVDAADAAGAHAFRVALAESPRLRLARALFVDALDGDRAWLRPGETRTWDLRFTDAGPAPSTAVLRVIGEQPGVDVLLDAPTPLQVQAGEWTAADPLRVTATAVGALDVAPAVRLGLAMDGGPETELELGIPVGLGPGISGEAFGTWTPGVLAAPFVVTSFDTLDFLQLPLPTVAGWSTRTDGVERYARDVDVELVSPWFAPPAGGMLGMWSRIESQASQPGDAFDGGVLEVWHPQQGWLPLVPESGPIVRIVHRSTAAVRGRVGLGGGPSGWVAVRAVLPESPWPTRVRLRFASDGAIEKSGWAVAGGGTEPAPGRAALVAARQPGGNVLVDARITGELTGVSRLRLAWRRPLDAAWTDVEPPRAYAPGGAAVSFAVALPADAPLVTFALFTDEDPRLLLGTTGYRAAAHGAQLLGVAPNPGLGSAQLLLAPADAARSLRIYDMRGRLVRRLVVPAYVRTAVWDGRDDQGNPAASGRYAIILTDAPGGSTVLTLLR